MRLAQHDADTYNRHGGFLARDFPHRSPWNPDWTRCALRDDHDRDCFDSRHVAGSMRICHRADGYYEMLVVSGPERGHVWIDGRVDDHGIYPSTMPGRERVDFLTWYDAWLDQAILDQRA